MFRKASLLLIILSVLTLLSCSPYRKVLRSTNTTLKYNTAVALYEKGDYHRAMQLFDELLIYYRGSDTSELINYYYAYCYYGEADYLQAGYYFLKFTTTFPKSKHAEECAYMAAYCQYLFSPEYSLDQSVTLDAMRGLQLFVDQYPKSERVAKCNELLDELREKLETKVFETGRLYLRIESYQAAMITFRNLLKEFPDTRYREEAYFLILKSTYLYAINSVESKRDERLNAAMDAYNALVSVYPETQFLKDAGLLQKNILRELSRTDNKQNKS